MTVVAGIGLLAFASAQPADVSSDLYPKGKKFPLGVYAIQKSEDMEAVKAFGWNITQTYQKDKDYIGISRSAGYRAMGTLPGKNKEQDEPLDQEEARQLISRLADNQNMAWWNIPEERRYWKPGEMQIVKKYFEWTRKYDPLKRPVYMYIPGHYQTKDIKHYVPYLDIIPASVYTTYSLQPHAWVRWRMEETIEGIRQAGAEIGPDYLNGQKTPVAILELFYLSTKPDRSPKVMTPSGAYHDFWQCIVSGARGILVFSYSHIKDKPSFKENWDMYSKAASHLTGEEPLGKVVLEGKDVRGVRFSVLSGPKETQPFRPLNTKEDITYPSLDLLCKTWNGKTYLIAVNSAEEEVRARISGLPKTVNKAEVLFEGKTTPLTNGVLEMDFAPLGVHIFKIG